MSDQQTPTAFLTAVGRKNQPGEFGINTTPSNEKLFLRNDNNELISFSSTDEITGTIDDMRIDAEAATDAANDAATLANEKAQYAEQQADYAKTQGDYARAQASATVYVNDIYDISFLHPTSGVSGGNTYASLSAALAVIPQDKKRGGMNIKYIQSFDNKYVQYRLMGQNFSTTESDWQGVDDEPTAGSDNLVKSGGVKNEIIKVEGQITDLIPVQENESLIKKGFIIVVGTQKWAAFANTKFIIYPLKGSGTIKYTPVSGVSHALYLLSDYTTPVSGADANVVGPVLSTGTTYDTTVKYLYILLEYTTNRLPSSITINGYDILLDLKENIGNMYNEREQTRMGLLLSGSNGVMEFDFTNKTCTIPDYGRVFFNSKNYAISREDRVLDLTVDYTGSPVGNYSGGVIVYDIEAGKCKVLKHSNATYNFNFIVLATFVSAYKIVNTPNRYSQDGKALNISIDNNSITTAMLQNVAVTPAKLSVMYTVGVLFSSTSTSKSLMSFDFIQKTCKIARCCRIFARSNCMYANTEEVTLDISKDSNGDTLAFGGVIVWDITTSSYKIWTYTNNIVNNNQIVIATFNLNGNVNSPSSFSIDGELYGITTKNKFNTISPNFELIHLPDGITWWSDFICVNNDGVDEMWFFTGSSYETHITSDGKIFRVRMSDWTLLGTITHNFGHCNTVHYDADSDNLLIGNLPGTQELPSALYIFYNVSSWASLSTLDFTTLSPSIVNVSSVVDSQLAAFWAENGIGIRNQVYIMRAFGVGKFAKIVLGMGNNQLTYGTYDSNHVGNNQFNGTYDIVVDGVDIKYPYGNDNNKNVIQGGDYAKGRVITANGHDQIYGRIWELQENVDGKNSINSTFINSVPRKANGTIDYSVGEGLCVKDGYVYQGLIKISADFRESYGVEGFYLAKYPLPY